jgi:hypothetical protein
VIRDRPSQPKSPPWALSAHHPAVALRYAARLHRYLAAVVERYHYRGRVMASCCYTAAS